jgi:GT2 family glycosyltransferase
MKITIEGICRGDGRIYVKAHLLGISLLSDLSVSSQVDTGITLPCSLHQLSHQHDRAIAAVIALPLLESGSQKLVFTLKNDNSLVDEKSISMKRAKWESRLNYRLRKKLCHEIRDFDAIATYDRINFGFMEAIRDENEFILRFYVWMPYHHDSNITLSCIDEKANPIHIDPIILNDEVRTSSIDRNMKIRELQYSIRISSSLTMLCLAARDQCHDSLSGFFTLEPCTFSNLVKKGDRMLRNAQIDEDYEQWFQNHKATIGELEKQRRIEFAQNPKFSIVVPLYKTPINLFQEMSSSVVSQSYKNWELILVNSTPDDSALCQEIERICSNDQRIHAISLKQNYGITENTNFGVEKATGDFVCFFDHDDLLEPNALFEYAKAINENPESDLLYCDEDKIRESGIHSDPFFKPDFNIDLLRSNNYICHFLTIRKSIIDGLEPASSAYDGAQDHNLTLRVSEKARYIHHIAKILYHWRITENSTASSADKKPYASQAGIRSVQEHLDRLGIPAQVSLSRRPFTYDVKYLVRDNPLVSILIPNKDNREMLDVCIQSILSKTQYENFEIVIIENNSSEPKTFRYYEEIQKQDSRVRVVYWDAEFNFSKLINYGASHAKGDYFLLLNNDTEVISHDWIDRMLGICRRNDVGIVGVRLLYQDGTIQHEGVLLDRPGGVAFNIYMHLPKENAGYFAFGDVTRDYTAVTAACMMTKKSIFNQVHGFTEELSVAFNDIDYCLKVRTQDYLVVYTPEVELFHYESTSRGQETTVEKKIRFFKETSYMHYRWARYYIEGDPQSNPNLVTGYMHLKNNA